MKEWAILLIRVPNALRVEMNPLGWSHRTHPREGLPL
jgi:hypothetical protein